MVFNQQVSEFVHWRLFFVVVGAGGRVVTTLGAESQIICISLLLHLSPSGLIFAIHLIDAGTGN